MKRRVAKKRLENRVDRTEALLELLRHDLVRLRAEWAEFTELIEEFTEPSALLDDRRGVSVRSVPRIAS